MGDAAAALRQSQHQLEVLDPVEGGVEAASLAHQRGACHEQMADVHRAECVHRRPVRLVKGGEPTPAAVELVLVGIEEVGRRVRLDRGGDHLQRVGRKHVVVVEEGDVLATGHRHGAVRRRRDPGVALGEVDPDPIVLGSCLLEHPLHVRRARPVVRHAQLPAVEALRPDRVDRLAKVRLPRVERGHHNRDQRRVGQGHPPRLHRADQPERRRARPIRPTARSGAVSFQLSVDRYRRCVSSTSSLELRYPRRLALELAPERLAERVELGLSVPTHPSPVPR